MLINGTETDLSSIGISTDEVYFPIIAQDGLLDFIHSRPKERRDKISLALGLDPIVRFKTVVDRARIKLQQQPPQVVLNAQARIRDMSAKMKRSASVKSIGERWEQFRFDLTNDTNELYQAVLGYLGLESGEWPVLTKELQQQFHQISQRIFEMTPIRISSQKQSFLQALGQLPRTLEEAINPLKGAQTQVIESTLAIYTQSQIAFWQAGLELYIPHPPDNCPMCEANTLTQEKRTELGQRIAKSSDYTSALQTLRQQASTTSQLIRRLIQTIDASLPGILNSEQRTRLQELFSDDIELCTTFLSTYDSTMEECQQIRRSIEQQAVNTENIHELTANAETLHEATDFVANLRGNLAQEIQTAQQAISNYHTAYIAFEPEIKKRIASTDEFREIEGLLAPLLDWNSLQILSEYYNLLSNSLNVLRQIEAHIQNKQREVFRTRGSEINNWYDLMNPGASVKYSRMEPGTDSLTLWANSFGVDMNAVACLSQCQLNCLGISIHLMRVTTPGSPFDFILMDDPVQSMDDDHTQALIIEVLENLLDQELQVIVFSHAQGLIDDIWETYYDRNPLRLRISDYTQVGPVIEDAETLAQAIHRGVQLSGGNEDNRRLAIKVVRRSVELLIRSVCRRSNSTAPAHDAYGNGMLPYFQGCPGTTPAQSQGLKTTFDFSNPATHTQVGWSIPTVTQIQPHIDRIRQTANQLGVL